MAALSVFKVLGVLRCIVLDMSFGNLDGLYCVWDLKK